MEESRFDEIRVYILKRQNTVAQYIMALLIIYLYERTVRKPGGWVDLRW